MRHVLLLLLFAASLAAQQARVPVELVGNRVHIPVSVNGSAPGSFILDTGAARSPLDTDFAEIAGVGVTGRTRVMGAGGSENVQVATPMTLAFAGLTVRTRRVPLIQFDAISLRIGRPLDGILGYEVLQRYVVEIDYEGRAVAFHDRKRYQPPAGAVRLPIGFNRGRVPVADVRISLPGGRTVTARVLVDTGAGGSLGLNRAFAKKHRIELENAIAMHGYGVGGGTRGRSGRLAAVELAGFRFERPVVSVFDTTHGALARSSIDGVLGGEILRRFTVIIDYARKQLLLVPNASLHEPFEQTATGVMLMARDTAFDAIVIHDLLAGAPAEEAGLRVGDELRAIDGRAVKPADLTEIRELLAQPDRRYVLTIVRNGEELTVPLLTRRLL
ncbi:MAG TPA: aspartyl protease family protein [Thermoanaerobaculia bacterium]|nr:aspartyl protease family protein [Thermoanaerobaculia bacterium]